MKRTQIYIDDTTFDFLQQESKIQKKTISQIIRESIRRRMSDRREEMIRKMEAVYGIWKDRNIDVDTYIRDLRQDCYHH